MARHMIHRLMFKIQLNIYNFQTQLPFEDHYIYKFGLGLFYIDLMDKELSIDHSSLIYYLCNCT